MTTSLRQGVAPVPASHCNGEAAHGVAGGCSVWFCVTVPSCSQSAESRSEAATVITPTELDHCDNSNGTLTTDGHLTGYGYCPGVSFL